MINILTISRVFLLLPLAWAMVQLEPTSWLPFGIFIFAAATDCLDGFLARKLNKTSAFGAMLDQICDKIFIVSTLVLIIARAKSFIPFFVCPVILIIAREFLVAGLREYAAQQGSPIPVDRFGKIKTVIQFVAIACMLCPSFVDFDSDAADWLKVSQLVIMFTSFIGIWLAMLMGWLSAWRYFNALKSPQ